MWLSRLCSLQTSPRSPVGLTLCLAEPGLTFSACPTWTGPLSSHHGLQPQGVVLGFPLGSQTDGSSSKLQSVFWFQETILSQALLPSSLGLNFPGTQGWFWH